MEKVVRDRKVAILVSYGYGAGWYSWNPRHLKLLFHPKLVEMVEKGKAKEIDVDWVYEHLGIEDVYCGGAKDLIIRWLPLGTLFQVDEYDGFESLTIQEDLILTA